MKTSLGWATRTLVGTGLSLIACVGTAAEQAPRPGAPAMPVAIGQQFLGVTIPTPQLKAQYPNNVEGLFYIPYRSISGFRTMTLDVYRTPGATARPALVWVHGGRLLSGGPREPHPMWGTQDGFLAYIASRGYVTVGITYRFGNEAKWPAQLQDTKAAIRFLRANAARFGIDPNHIGVMGESAGGGVAAMAGTTCGVTEFDDGDNLDQSSCVQAVIDWYGVSDMNQLDSMAPANATLIHNGPDSSQSIVLGCSLHYTCTADVVKRANPIAYIDSKTLGTKFLIMHGDDDRAVSWKQAQLLHDALRAKNVPSTLNIVPGVDHYFGRATAEQAKMILDTLMNFLAESLGGGGSNGKAGAARK
jgi:acetyl esterase/lipase